MKRVGPNNVDAHLGPVGTRLAVVVDRKWDRSMRVRQRVDQFRDILTIEVFHRREYVVIHGEAKYELENVSVWPLKPVNPLRERWTTTQDGYLMAKQNAEFETEIPEGRAFTVEVIFGPESSGMEVSKLIQVIPPGKGHRGFLSDATGLGIRHSEMGSTLAFCMPNDTLARPTFVVLQGSVVESIRSFEGCSLE